MERSSVTLRPEFSLLTASSILTVGIQAMQTAGERVRSCFPEMFATCGLSLLSSMSREQLFQQTTVPPAGLNQLEFPVTGELTGSHTTLPLVLQDRSPLPFQPRAWQLHPYLLCPPVPHSCGPAKLLSCSMNSPLRPARHWAAISPQATPSHPAALKGGKMMVQGCGFWMPWQGPRGAQWDGWTQGTDSGKGV